MQKLNAGLKAISNENGTDGLYRNVRKLSTNQRNVMPPEE